MAYHHGDLRSALLARAEQVLAASGADGVSLRSLARDLGVSHAAPARHFADRRALLSALAVEGFDRLRRELVSALASEIGYENRVLAAARAYVRFAVEHPALLQVMYALKHDADTDAVRGAADDCAAVLLMLFAEGGDRNRDPERFGVLMLAALHGIAALAGSGAFPPGHDPDDVVVDLVNRLVAGGH